jgi:hypothetical protein
MKKVATEWLHGREKEKARREAAKAARWERRPIAVDSALLTRVNGWLG